MNHLQRHVGKFPLWFGGLLVIMGEPEGLQEGQVKPGCEWDGESRGGGDAFGGKEVEREEKKKKKFLGLVLQLRSPSRKILGMLLHTPIGYKYWMLRTMQQCR